MRRRTIVAGMFYPAEPERCRSEVARLLRDAGSSLPAGPFVAGLVPHAGWAYSGKTAARTFAALAASGTPDVLVLFGAVHTWSVVRPSIYGRGSWETPLGDIDVDETLSRDILQLARDRIDDDPRAHAEEHSLEVQLPFVRYLFPQARIVPIAVPPTPTAVQLGEWVADVVQTSGKRVCVVGSTDLTHYGPRYGHVPAGVGAAALTWAKENDRRLLDRILALQAEQIVPLASQEHSACGAGAIAATTAAARRLGARQGILLEYTTSYDVHPAGAPTDFVGYAAVAF